LPGDVAQGSSVPRLEPWGGGGEAFALEKGEDATSL
ncbi:MAG: hypothetical protein ACI8PQ_001951, partial [Planctomycetota bacterium]